MWHANNCLNRKLSITSADETASQEEMKRKIFKGVA